MFNFGFLKTEVPAHQPENQRGLMEKLIELLKKVVR